MNHSRSVAESPQTGAHAELLRGGPLLTDIRAQGSRHLTSLLVGVIIAVSGVTACTRGPASGDRSVGETAPSTKSNGERPAPESPPATGRVTLSEEAFQTARLLVESPRPDAGGSSEASVDVPAQVEFDPARVAVVSPRAAGRLERMLAVPGDRVARDQVVAEVQSAAFAVAVNDYLQAGRRLQHLVGTPDEAGAKAVLDAARRRLELLGVAGGAIDQLATGVAGSALMSVTAPFSGSVIESLSLPGQAVEAGTPLYRLADLSVVLVAAEVPERALQLVRVGDRAVVRALGTGEVVFTGRVARVSDVVDPEKRTAKAYVEVANPARALKPGMFANVRLRDRAAAGAPGLTVPEDAVMADGTARYVFVEVGARTFERRAVEVAPSPYAGGGPAGGRLTIVSGLSTRDRVVTRGAFTLKSELAKFMLADPD
ncbi:MAG: efflux RND transporter periplasmic adaptor subunit [Gemmatimonadetes bacterium]|nr:efflux RND transporter periplasmic adaptor subunit [Gemmatimonadota bacterium]